jgi:hypothetical protein
MKHWFEWHLPGTFPAALIVSCSIGCRCQKVSLRLAVEAALSQTVFRVVPCRCCATRS